MVTLPTWGPIFMSHTFLRFLSPRHLGFPHHSPPPWCNCPWQAADQHNRDAVSSYGFTTQSSPFCWVDAQQDYMKDAQELKWPHPGRKGHSMWGLLPLFVVLLGNEDSGSQGNTPSTPSMWIGWLGFSVCTPFPRLGGTGSRPGGRRHWVVRTTPRGVTKICSTLHPRDWLRTCFPLPR